MYSQDFQKPTVDNPFANVLLGDSKNRPPAGPIDEVKHDLDDKFND